MLEGEPKFEGQPPQEESIKKPETGKKVFKFLDRTGFLEARQSDEKFEEYLQSLSYEDYKDDITRLNGILRGKPIKGRSIDGKGVEVSLNMAGESFTSYLPPSAEDKGDMLRESFDAIKNIPDNNSRGLLAYYSIQAIHPYADGNGRTGRLVYNLFSEKGKQLTQERLSELLDHEDQGETAVGKGREVFAEEVLEPNKAYSFINREVAKNFLGDDFTKEYGSIYYSGDLGAGSIPSGLDVSKEDADLAVKIMGEGEVGQFPFRGLAIYKLLQENGKLADCQYQLSVPTKGGLPEDAGKKILGIDAEKFEANVTAEDVKRLIEIHKNLKKEFIKTMIDIFEHPDHHKTQIEGNDYLIKDFFSLSNYQKSTEAAKESKEEEKTEDGLGIMVKRKTLYHGSATTGINKFTQAEEDTVGSGIYFTSEAKDAIGYARRRSRSRKDSSPIVYETSVENVKLLDLRQDDNVHKILDGFKQLLADRLKEPDLRWNVQEVLQNAVNAINQNKVGAGNLREVTFGTGKMFSEYVNGLGYDGLVAIEGGEGEDIGSHDTYLLFEPEKIKIKEEHKIL